MDKFDEAILDALIDEKSRSFNQLLEKSDFAHNTLRLHLDKLVDHAIVTREKVTKEGRGEAILHLLVEFRRSQGGVDASIRC